MGFITVSLFCMWMNVSKEFIGDRFLMKLLSWSRSFRRLLLCSLGFRLLSVTILSKVSFWNYSAFNMLISVSLLMEFSSYESNFRRFLSMDTLVSTSSSHSAATVYYSGIMFFSSFDTFTKLKQAFVICFSRSTAYEYMMRHASSLVLNNRKKSRRLMT